MAKVRMTLIARSLSALRQSRHLGPNIVVTSLWLGLLVGLEWSGARVTSEIADILALGLVVTLGVFTVRFHRDRAPLAWVPLIERFLRRSMRVVGALGFQIGFDFRGRPPIEQRVPHSLIGLCSVFLGMLLVLSLTGVTRYPEALRDTLGAVSYVVYLGVIGVLWSALMVSGFLFIAFLLASLHDWVIPRRERIGARAEVLLHCTLFVLLLGAASALPPRWALIPGAVGVLVCVATILAGPAEVTPILWRSRRTGEAPAALSRRCAALLLFGIALQCFSLLLLLALGGALGEVTAQDERAPMTHFLGRTLLWSSCVALWVLVGREVQDLRSARALSPRRTPLQRLSVVGAPAEERGKLQFFWRERGWIVRFYEDLDGASGAGTAESSAKQSNARDVVLQWVNDTPVIVDPWRPTSWPLRVDHASFDDPLLVARCERRLGQQYRRRLGRGVRRLFKSANRRQDGAEGSWFAPQYDFLKGLVREGAEGEIDLEHEPLLVTHVGIPYAEVFAPAVRVYYGEVMSALEVDLIFVEDGVGDRRFRRVLDSLFETFDVFGGGERAEERHLTGIPGIRTIFHEYDFDQPYRSEVYPEPEYTPVARARILHVFKDRGEEDEVPDVLPFDIQNAPVGGLFV